MKQINILQLVLWFLIATSAGFGYSNWAAGNGYRIPISGISLSISIAVACVVLLLLAMPIWRYKRALKKVLEDNKTNLQRPVPVDPFYAVRVLVLAKASAIVAVLFIGWHLGVIIKLLSSPVVVVDAYGPNLSAGVVSVVLLVCAFVVQAICRLPNDSGPKDGAVPA